MVGCGIPQIVFLAPPVLEPISGFGVLSFTHDTENDQDSFFGYEIYYKFYDPDTGTGTDGRSFTDDRSAIANAGPTSIVSALGGRGYRRVTSGTTAAGPSDPAAPPVIEIEPADAGTAFMVTVTLQPPTEAAAIAEWSAPVGGTRYLFRDPDVWSATGLPLSFVPEDLDPDADYSDLPGAGAGSDYDLGIVVLAYGVDFVTGTFSQIYSTAAIPSQPVKAFHE